MGRKKGGGEGETEEEREDERELKRRGWEKNKGEMKKIDRETGGGIGEN